MLAAVIFDLDGTVVDSNAMHAEAWQRAFRKFGKEFSLDELRAQIGKGGDHYLPVFLNQIELREIGPQIEEYRGELFKKEYLPRVRAFPKVRELFERIKKHGRKIALASSGKEDEVAHYQKIADIDGLVDSLAASDEVEHSKPSPDVFCTALNKLGHLAPQEAIAIGDTPYDIIGGKKIGLPVIALLCGGFAEDDLRSSGAAAIYRDPADLLENYLRSPLAS